MIERQGNVGLMGCMRNTQHRVIHGLVTIRMQGHRFGHDGFNFFCYHAELSAMTPLIAERGLVVEEIQADAERMDANLNDIFFGYFGRHETSHVSIIVAFRNSRRPVLGQVLYQSKSDELGGDVGALTRFIIYSRLLTVVIGKHCFPQLDIGP